MNEILRYISLLTLVGTAISFVIGLFQWIDQRNREQEQKQYEAFHKMVGLASGIGDRGETIKMLQQIAAIYQLQAYKKYAFASIPVLKALQFEIESSDVQSIRDTSLKKALNETIEVLSIYSSKQ